MSDKLTQATELLDYLTRVNRDVSQKWGPSLLQALILIELQLINKNLTAANEPKSKTPQRKKAATKQAVAPKD